MKQARGIVDPDDAAGSQIEQRRGEGRGRMKRRGAMREVAGGTTTIMRGVAGLIGLAWASPIVMTDDGGMQRIGGSDGRCPAGRDRRNDLHRQGKQHYRKEFPQPPAHQAIPSLQRSQLNMLPAGCRDRGLDRGHPWEWYPAGARLFRPRPVSLPSPTLFPGRWRIQLDGFNLHDSKSDQITYAYGSLLKSDSLFACASRQTARRPRPLRSVKTA